VGSAFDLVCYGAEYCLYGGAGGCGFGGGLAVALWGFGEEG
jgi:hypothetical protein